jgi:phosphate starvation-inducible PhoH-like protein
MKTPPKRTSTSARRVKEKFVPELTEENGQQYVLSMPRFEAKNTNQKLALSFLNEGRHVVFLTGSAGSGKSMIAAYHAAKLLKSKRIEKVYLVRPAVAVGKSLGMLPGDLTLKLQPFFAQIISHLTTFLGAGAVQYMLEKNVIEMQAVEYMRGMSFQDCCVIFEEAQNFTADEMELCLTRMGENCSYIFTADQKQHDLKGISGVTTTLRMFQHALETAPDYLDDSDLGELESGIGIVQFMPADVLRSGITRSFVKLYYNQGA